MSFPCTLLNLMVCPMNLTNWNGGSVRQDELPNWSKACKIALLTQPSSAATERVFSLPNFFLEIIKPLL